MNKHAKSILSKTQPTQAISLKALTKLVGVKEGSVYEGLRELRAQGLATMQVRRGHKDGSLIQFHKDPVAPQLRDAITKHHHDSKANGLFTIEQTFQVKGGTYTAKQLEPLAKKVLRALHYDVTS